MTYLDTLKAKFEKAKRKADAHERNQDLTQIEIVLRDSILAPETKLYNLYRGSIPNGPFKPMVIGLTRTQADDEAIKYIRKEYIRREKAKEQNTTLERYYFYEIVAMDATDEEKSPFYNACEITQNGVL